jgi:PPOX class probable F420-dependent enzyme
MEFEAARPFMEKHHWSVVTTHQGNGSAQSSIVFSGAYLGHAAFVAVYGQSAKVRNLRRDSRCTVLNVTKDWLSWVCVEGKAQLFDYGNTESEEMRQMFREIYRACGDRDHPDWDEYDHAMVQQQAVAVLVRPDRVYGLLRKW